MKLFTKAQYEQLLKNGSPENRDKDHKPVAKLVLTTTNCVWLLTEIDPAVPYIAFGLCDLGLGFPELGNLSLVELKKAANPFQFRYLVTDPDFVAEFPISVYASIARSAGYIEA